jgi:hypothetical protein
MLEKISSFENSENLEESLHQSLSISQVKKYLLQNFILKICALF